jgi:environmental stress-induced protein Ves
MHPVVVRLADVTPQPWKNGHGAMRELLVRPAGVEPRLRISVADIGRDSPFSSYPGVERWFTVIDGAGVVLHFADGPRTVKPDDPPLRFAGADAPGCTLVDGPVRALNLMLRGVAGQLVRVADGRDWTPPTTCAGLFATAAGDCEADGTGHALPDGALLWFDAAPSVLRFTPATAPSASWWLAADTRA